MPCYDWISRAACDAAVAERACSEGADVNGGGEGLVRVLESSTLLATQGRVAFYLPQDNGSHP